MTQWLLLFLTFAESRGTPSVTYTQCWWVRSVLSRRSKHYSGIAIVRPHYSIHSRHSRLAESGRRASFRGFVLRCSQLRFGAVSERTCKLVRLKLLPLESGEPGRTRTSNPLIKSQLLYH
jgi:hypothetical protein